MAEFIFEIGCEEIPARFIEPALASLKELFVKELDGAGISHGEIGTYGTPRRLGLTVLDVNEEQPDRVEKVLGPKIDFCYDKDGKPTKALIGFSKGQGVDPEAVEVVDGPKGGKVVQATKTIKGQPTVKLLEEILNRLIRKMPFPKSMRWASYDEGFARPVHWIVALLGQAVVPVVFSGVESGRFSYGHRFLAPEAIEVTGIQSHLDALRNAYVLPTQAERREFVRSQAQMLAEQAGGHLLADDGLVQEVANLVEYPVALIGRFDDEFLEVPKEILIDSMATHQRYFAVADKNGKLLPNFILFANNKVDDPNVVINGNARVLRARLSDARFFFKEDKKKTLDDFAASLGTVTFEERLGSVAEKVARIQEHVRYMVSFIAPETLEETLRAAALCKADLLSAVVYEFPELQGTMGRIYAELGGESELVSQAIEQHYWPRFAEDDLPQTDVAAMVALADKMDTIVGCFGVGLIPSGTADPYALRRQAIGVLRTLVDKGYRINLNDWITFAIGTLQDKLTRDAEETRKDVLDFIEGRYRNWRVKECAQDTLDAVVSARFGIVSEVEGRIQALSEFRKHSGFESLAVAFKRIMNILKEKPSGVVSPDLFEAEAESELWSLFQRVRDEVGILVRQGDFLGAMQAMVALRPAVDRFFDDVMVMAEDARIRENRLVLLNHLAGLFEPLVDFRKIQTLE